MKIMNLAIVVLLFNLLVACDMGQQDTEEDSNDNHAAVEKEPFHAGENKSAPIDAFASLNLGAADKHPEGDIIFSLEQQSLVDFATVTAVKQQMRSSIEATGSLQASSGGQAMVAAPVSGYLATLETPFPSFGDRVNPGDILVKIVPRLDGEKDPASLDLQVRRSSSSYQLANKELVRLQFLFEQGVVSERRVQAALKEEQIAKAELDSAKQRFKQSSSRPDKANGATTLAVTSPVVGILDGVYVTPGAYLQEGDALFHVVNTEKLRLAIQVPEADIARLINPQGAWFTVDGFDAPFHVDLAKGDRLLASGSIVDPQTRTVPLVFEFPNVDSQLRIGMFARVNVIVGEAKEAIAIPAAAVQEYGGLAVVYVQSHDDAFERRIVELGICDGDAIEVKRGIEMGDKVVTRGSYLIQLAASGPQEVSDGHGH